MRSKLSVILAFVAGGLLGLIASPQLGGQFRTTTTTQLLKTDLAGCDGKEVTVSLAEAEPGTSGPHYHPGESFTYILEGSEVYQVEGTSRTVAKTGDLLHEKPMQIHTTGNTAPVKLLVVRILDKGQPDTVRVGSNR